MSDAIRRRQAPTGEWQYEGADGYWYDEAPAAAAAPAPGATVAGAPPSSAVHAGAWFVVIGAALGGLGALLPWTTAVAPLATVDRNAFQLGENASISSVGPALVVLAVAGVVLGIVILVGARVPRNVLILPVLLGASMTLLVGSNYPQLSGVRRDIRSFDGTVSVSYGYWLAIVGGGLVLVGGIILLSRAQKLSATTAQTAPSPGSASSNTPPG